MNQTEIQVCITFQGKPYFFDFGSQAYIFHTGIYNDFYNQYGMDALLQYTGFVHDCYLSDSERTPLGALADYIAQRWENVKSKNKHEVLYEFYQSV